MKRIPLSLTIGAALLAGAALLYAAERHASPAQAPAVLPALPDASTIRDEPIVAPDPKQSADHNISFPADI